MMGKCLLLFISMMAIIFTACDRKNETREAVLPNHRSDKPVVLESKYLVNPAHTKEKKIVKRKIKKLDTVISHQFDQLKDWVSNVGEAIDLME